MVGEKLKSREGEQWPSSDAVFDGSRWQENHQLVLCRWHRPAPMAPEPKPLPAVPLLLPLLRLLLLLLLLLLYRPSCANSIRWHCCWLVQWLICPCCSIIAIIATGHAVSLQILLWANSIQRHNATFATVLYCYNLLQRYVATEHCVLLVNPITVIGWKQWSATISWKLKLFIKTSFFGLCVFLAIFWSFLSYKGKGNHRK